MPGQAPSFNRIHHISTHRFYRIKLVRANGKTQLELRTRDSCDDKYWSLFHLLRSNTHECTGLNFDDLSQHPGYTCERLSDEYLEKIRTSMAKCKPRVSEEQWAQLMHELDTVFNPDPPSQLDPEVCVSVVCP